MENSFMVSNIISYMECVKRKYKNDSKLSAYFIKNKNNYYRVKVKNSEVSEVNKSDEHLFGVKKRRVERGGERDGVTYQKVTEKEIPDNVKSAVKSSKF